MLAYLFISAEHDSKRPPSGILRVSTEPHCQAVDKLFAEQKFDGVIHFAGLKVWQVTRAILVSI